MAERRIPGTNLAWRDLPLWLGGMALAFAWGAPFVWMVSTSLKPPGQVMTKQIEWLPREVTFANYAKVFEYPILTWAMNSLIQADGHHRLVRPVRRHGRLRPRPPALSRPRRCCSCCSWPP